jgi:hypothetical protein
MRPITDLELAPGQVFREIREVFTDLGLLGNMISVEYEGVWYRISCDDTAFMVYRVNEYQRVRHHLPGWPVCLVNSHIIFEESGHPGIGQDHCACGVELDRWLEIVNEYCISNLSENFQE